MTSRLSSRPPRALFGAAVAAALVALIPLVYLVVRVADAGLAQVLETLARPRTVETVGTSVALTLVVVAACLLLGLPTAWLLARARVWQRRGWLVLVALPLAIPSYVAAYAWIAIFPGMSGFWAAAFVLTLVSLPYVVVPVVAALRSADPSLEEVARTLGRGPRRAFVEATLPQAWPAAAAGSLLVALYVLSDFGAVSLFRVDAFTRVIYASYRASFDRTTAAVLALVLVALAAGLVLLERRVRGRSRRFRTSGAALRPAPDVALTGRGQVGALAWLGVLIGLAIVVPVASLLIRLAEGSRRPLDVGELARAAANSAGVSLIGAALAVALAVPVALLAARYRGARVSAVETAAYSGHALPGVVVGLSLVFLTINLFPAAYQTIATLAFAYAVLFLPKSIGATRSAVAAVPPILEQTARTLGRSAFGAWRSTTLRLAWPGAAAGGLLVLLTAMKELPATLMLRPTGLDTLATELWSRTEVAAYGAAAPYALALIALAAVPAWLMSTAMHRRGGSTQRAADDDEADAAVDMVAP
ncbi:MAG: ABC transporter permease subunit [Actinomycetota bacterium]|nr:ABC transporter permease subunit [Actinomycetota bacterium]